MHATIASQRDDLAMPQGLTLHAQAAWRTIVAMLKKHEATYTGGCKAFYSPAEWAARAETYGRDSLLIVVYDGGEVGDFFGYEREQYSLIEKMTEELHAIGCYAQACTGWYAAIYPC